MEQSLLVSGLCTYFLALIIHTKSSSLAKTAVVIGLLLHGSAILMRWQSIGHGPYIGLYDSLSSNLWVQLFLLSALVIWKPKVQASLFYGLLLSLPFVLWLLRIPPDNIELPPTYNTIWFYFHLYAGKLAYGLLFIAVSLILLGLRRHTTQHHRLVQFVMFTAFVSHTILLFAGANWAYLAWGIYWDWNILEIWSLLSWIGFGIYFHRDTVADNDWLPSSNGIAIVIYLFSILGFYGIPFLSKATHQGLV